MVHEDKQKRCWKANHESSQPVWNVPSQNQWNRRRWVCLNIAELLRVGLGKISIFTFLFFAQPWLLLIVLALSECYVQFWQSTIPNISCSKWLKTSTTPDVWKLLEYFSGLSSMMMIVVCAMVHEFMISWSTCFKLWLCESNIRKKTDE